jgi:hypothetical protein
MRYYCGKALDEDKAVKIEVEKKETPGLDLFKKIVLFPFTLIGMIFHELFNKYVEKE